MSNWNGLDRRRFLLGAAGAAMSLSIPDKLAAQIAAAGDSRQPDGIPQNAIFVSLTGSDANTGGITYPLRSFKAAQATVRMLKEKTAGAVSVYFRSGTYYLPETIVFTPPDSGEPEAPV